MQYRNMALLKLFFVGYDSTCPNAATGTLYEEGQFKNKTYVWRDNLRTGIMWDSLYARVLYRSRWELEVPLDGSIPDLIRFRFRVWCFGSLMSEIFGTIVHNGKILNFMTGNGRIFIRFKWKRTKSGSAYKVDDFQTNDTNLQSWVDPLPQIQQAASYWKRERVQLLPCREYSLVKVFPIKCVQHLLSLKIWNS